MSRTVESGVVDAAMDTLKSAATNWLAAGGSPDLLTTWMMAKMQSISPPMAKAVTRNRGVRINAIANKTLSSVDNRSAA